MLAPRLHCGDVPRNFVEDVVASDAFADIYADQDSLIRLFTEYDRLVSADGTDAQRLALARKICRRSMAYVRMGEEVLARSSADQADARDLIDTVWTRQPEESFYNAWVALLGCCMRQLVERDQTQLFSHAARIVGGDREGAARGSLDS